MQLPQRQILHARTSAQWKHLIVSSLIFWVKVIAAITLFVMLMSMAYDWLLPYLQKPFNLYDEGTTLLGAQRSAWGEVLYRDYWTMYMPLKFWTLSQVFEWYSSSIDVSRMYSLVVSMVSLMLCMVLFWRTSGSVFFGMVAGMFLLGFGNISMTILLMVLVSWLLYEWIREPRGWLAFGLGLSLGVMFLWRWDFGGFLALTSVLLAGLSLIVMPRSLAPSIREYLILFGLTSFGSLLIVIPALMWIWQEGAFTEMLNQTFLFPLFGSYQELRTLAWPEVSDLTDTFVGYSVDFRQLSQQFSWWWWVIPSSLAVIYWCAHVLRGRKVTSAVMGGIILLMNVIAALIYVSHRADYGHTIFLSMVATILALHLIGQFRGGWWLFTPVLLSGMILVMLNPVVERVELERQLIEGPTQIYSWSNRPFLKTDQNDELQAVLDYFAQVPAEEEVWVGVSDTSRVYVNNIVLPYLLQRPVPTKWHELHTGIVTTAVVQNQMIEELKDVNYVVIWDTFYCEDNLSCESSGVYLVRDYLEQNYQLEEQHGGYFIYKRG